MRFPTILLLAALIPLLAACQLYPVDPGPKSEQSFVLRTGTSFGECLGYCWTELQVDEEQTVLTRKGWEIGRQLPDRQYTRATGPTLWSELVRLVDMDALRELDDVYGCPDCADGGAEWIEVEQDGERKKVTFEYGTAVEQIRSLIETVRAEREAFLAEV